MYLFIDDERMPPAYLKGHGVLPVFDPSYTGFYDCWYVKRNMLEVRRFIERAGIPNFISFDHDLGKNEPTGLDIAKHIAELVMDGFNALPTDFDFTVHSQNPIGKKNIEMYLDGFLASLGRIREPKK